MKEPPPSLGLSLFFPIRIHLKGRREIDEVTRCRPPTELLPHGCGSGDARWATGAECIEDEGPS